MHPTGTSTSTNVTTTTTDSASSTRLWLSSASTRTTPSTATSTDSSNNLGEVEVEVEIDGSVRATPGFAYHLGPSEDRPSILDESLEMLTGCRVYSSPVSSSILVILRPLGVPQE